MITQNAPRRILLGLTGGIAAYKAAELARLFVKNGYALDVVMTEAAQAFITPLTFQALIGKPVANNFWRDDSNGMPHITLSRDKDIILVAPASADFLAKLAHGLADDLLSATCLARQCKLLVAPAMNTSMWEHPATVRNIQQLINDGVIILGPGEASKPAEKLGLDVC